MDALKLIEKDSTKAELPKFNIGDTVKVSVNIREGQRERIQIFEGFVLKKQNGGIGETFTVRRIASGVGVENVSNEKQTKVYPRLIANGEVLTVESPANSTIRLMTMQGSVIMQQETTNSFTRLPINGLSQGIYLLTVVNASNQQTFKVIVK